MDNTKPKVAAYARVSSAFESQENSFENQVMIYTERITGNPNYVFAGVYADKATTGTTDDRPEFQRLMRDCKSGLIDIILVKSISRFARNVLITVETVRMLTEMNVTIIFEKENIDTSKPYSEMLLTILAAFAQEESRNISERVKKGLQMRAKNGEVRWKPIYGYTRIGDEEYVIVPKEAEIVRAVYHEYEHGKTISDVARIMEQRGIPMQRSTIRDMLANVKYAGDIITGKRYVGNHLKHNVLINHVEVEQSYIENHHEGIIDKKTFNRVQHIRKLRSKNNGIPQYPFGEMLKCPFCGKPLIRDRLSHSAIENIMICKNAPECGSFAVKESVITQAIMNVYNREKMPDDKIDSVEYWWLDDFIDNINFDKNGQAINICWKSKKKSSATLDCKKYTMEYVLKEAKKQAQESE